MGKLLAGYRAVALSVIPFKNVGLGQPRYEALPVHAPKRIYISEYGSILMLSVWTYNLIDDRDSVN